MAIGTYDSNARSATTTSSNMALIEKLQGDTDLKKKLEKVISILSSIKNDFNWLKEKMIEISIVMIYKYILG